MRSLIINIRGGDVCLALFEDGFPVRAECRIWGNGGDMIAEIVAGSESVCLGRSPNNIYIAHEDALDNADIFALGRRLPPVWGVGWQCWECDDFRVFDDPPYSRTTLMIDTVAFGRRCLGLEVAN